MSNHGSLKYVISLSFLGLLLLAALIFGGWAYSSRSDYKYNSDKKTTKAAEAAKSAQKAQDQKDFEEKEKSPLKTYYGSQTYGSVIFNYPKTWSAYVDTTDSNQPINGYFYPDIVPSTQSKTAYALRIELLNQDFATTLSNHTADVQNGDARALVYIPPKMVNVPGVQPGLRLEGTIDTDVQGQMVIVKVRDKTLQISTQSSDFFNDFNNTVLASLTFVP